MREGTARALTARQIVDIWDRGADQPVWMRALTILSVAGGDGDTDRLASLPLGGRDRMLLDLHERTFGPVLRGLVRCPACDESVALSVHAGDLHADVPADDGSPLVLECEGYTLTYVLPDTHCLAFASLSRSAGDARERIFARCIRSCVRDGEAVAHDRVPEPVLRALADAMTARDPQAEVLLDVRCPACDHAWTALFDIATLTWATIQSHAARILSEVHALARAYGWTESDIWALSPRRRRHYLDLVGT